ncbi:MAG: chloride channel protein [Candidatus Krumholzibacteriota bacterium]|nr:chloride channel protein [Candidatus Krumholzibacteriota bacterium]
MADHPDRIEDSTPPGRRPVFAGLGLRLGGGTGIMLVAIAIGLAAGLGAVFFRWLIDASQDLAWGTGGTPLAKFARSSWQLRLVVPAAGGALVGLIVKYLAPEARGHGVPEVMLAVARLGGVIRPVVAVAKSFASALCIATGGSVGREGPIVQIGAAIGSTVGQLLRMPTRQIRTGVGCGAAAGIAATFNAPIAGAFFATEVILGEFSTGAFGAVVISSVSATVVSRMLLGDVPAFAIPEYSIVHPAEMLTYAVLGLLAALIGVAFVRALHASEDLFERLRRVPDWIKPVIGGLGIGALGLALPQIMGVGYDTIGATLHGDIALGLLLAVLAVKLVATTFTLGSGGSGGIFAPSLFMGAALGGAVGLLARLVVPFPMASSGAYAVVGMGALVAAATHAPITAILIIFELTGDYGVIPGLMVSCIIGTLLAQRMYRGSIYTIKLLRRGIDLQAGQELNVLRQLRVRDVMTRDMEIVPRSECLADLYDRMINSLHYEFFVVDGAGDLIGIISFDSLRQGLPHMQHLGRLAIAEDLMSPLDVFLREDDDLDVAMRQFGKRTLEELPVLPAGGALRPVGTIQRQDVINAYNKEILKVDLGGSLSSRISSVARHRTWETVGGYVVSQMEAPPHLCGRPLEFLRLRQEKGIQLILIERGADGRQFILPTRTSVLEAGDRIILFGRREDVNACGGAPVEKVP